MKRNKGNISGLMALLLLCVFAICVVLVLLTGTEVYSGLVGRDQASYDRALPLRYLTTRVRQADRADGIAISDFEGTNALEIREVYDGYVYVTQIYCYEGQMRELFSAEDSGLMPEDGEVLMPLEDMNLSLEGELLTIDVRHPNGQTDTLRLCLRHRGEVLP